jgi:hypothetical protein
MGSLQWVRVRKTGLTYAIPVHGMQCNGTCHRLHWSMTTPVSMSFLLMARSHRPEEEDDRGAEASSTARTGAEEGGTEEGKSQGGPRDEGEESQALPPTQEPPPLVATPTAAESLMGEAYDWVQIREHPGVAVHLYRHAPRSWLGSSNRGAMLVMFCGQPPLVHAHVIAPSLPHELPPPSLVKLNLTQWCFEQAWAGASLIRPRSSP